MNGRLCYINITLLYTSLLIIYEILILCKLHDTCSRIVYRRLFLKVHYGEEFGLIVLETKYCLAYINFSILIFEHKRGTTK